MEMGAETAEAEAVNNRFAAVQLWAGKREGDAFFDIAVVSRDRGRQQECAFCSFVLVGDPGREGTSALKAGHIEHAYIIITYLSSGRICTTAIIIKL